MKYRIIDRQQHKYREWSGGKSTELYIYPEDANYLERHFLWRVSYATVDADKTSFTPLYGVKRWIMPLESPLLLMHKNDMQPLYDISVKPYEAHCFKGEWETVSYGKTNDFNLMLKEGAYGILKHYKVPSDQEIVLSKIFPESFDERLPLYQRRLSMGIYCIEEPIEILHPEGLLILPKEQLFLMDYQYEEGYQLANFLIRHQAERSVNIVLFFVSY
ncbi:HutD family protein [Fusibacter paucivorans]|uniref:HutD family protein n=1 Tax=Fusibacter paucivorans TaxID=76009 RepID=A0ABS5PR01_9FIRM|nr:HutD family protein [Fusibacter paucivorans]MBS7527026.1 HutD family protein [Fusibacter paucivorans]